MSRFGRFAGILAAILTSPTAGAEGNSPRISYMLHCQGCHLPGGIGHPGLVPNLAGEVGLFLASEGGRRYLVQVPGAAQSDLEDGELAGVLNWMLAEFDPARVGEDFEPYTGAEVAQYRSTKLIAVSATRRALLAQ